MPLVATWTETDVLFGAERTYCHTFYALADGSTLGHGYCLSLYVTDPNGLLVEFSVDHADVERINEDRRRTARQDLARWLGGDHTSNNSYR